MADAESPTESPAQRQARIRREKREKKILQGGSARLDKITGMSGRTTEPAPLPPSQTAHTAATPDPEEVDISTHPFSSNIPSSAPTEADIRALLRGGPPGSDINPFGPGPDQFGPRPGSELGEDPMMKMLQQMMAGGGMPGMPGAPGGGGGGGEMPNLPPALAAMLGGAGSGGVGGMPTPAQPAATATYVWKIVHAVFAFALAGYILHTRAFSGSLAARLSPLGAGSAPSFEGGAGSLFWAFATAQLVLQSGRFVLQREQAPAGMMDTVAGFLPPPWGGRLRLGLRYSGIWTTLVGDAMVVVFVLGCAAWWKGEVV